MRERERYIQQHVSPCPVVGRTGQTFHCRSGWLCPTRGKEREYA